MLSRPGSPLTRQPRPVRWIVWLMAAAFSLAVTIAAAAGPAGPAAAATPSPSGSTLRVESQTAFSTFNPFTAYFDGDLEVIDSVYPWLTSTSSSGKPVPYLASGWTVSADKLTWTFTLHSGLKWSDGKPITAADAAWTLNLIMHNPTAATANGALVASFAKVTAPSSTTLVITTRQPEANMPYLLYQLPIVPQHIWAKEVSKLGSFSNQQTPVVGYGPFTLTGYAPNQYATLTANKDFLLGAPKFHTVIVQYYSNSDAAVAALRSGQLDVIEYMMTAPQFNALKGVRHVKLYPQVSATWTGIELNPGARTRAGRHFGNGNPALHDVRVRQAIEMAINKQELVSKVWSGLAVPGQGYLPPAYPELVWSPPASQQLSYDPAKAGQLLTAAGYKMGSNGYRIDPKTHKPLTLRLGIHSDEASDAAMAPYIVEWLKAIGIQVTVQSMSFNQLNTELPKGDWDMLSDTWSLSSPDPTNLLSIQTCGDLPLNNGTAGNTDAFFCDPAFDKLYARQSTEFSVPQRTQTLGQMQQILYRNAVDVILYYPDWLSAVRTDVVKNYFHGKPDAKGFYPTPNRMISWLSATPVSDSPGSSPGATLWIVLGVVAVVVVAGAALVIRRRATAGERE